MKRRIWLKIIFANFFKQAYLKTTVCVSRSKPEYHCSCLLIPFLRSACCSLTSVAQSRYLPSRIPSFCNTPDFSPTVYVSPIPSKYCEHPFSRPPYSNFVYKRVIFQPIARNKKHLQVSAGNKKTNQHTGQFSTPES